MARCEVVGQKSQKVGMIRLDGLAGRKVIRIEPGRIDIVGRLDDAQCEQFFPQVVHCSDRELRIGGQHAAVSVPPRFARARLLTGP